MGVARSRKSPAKANLKERSDQLARRYSQRDGRILITGVQALVRLMLIQADRDKRQGLRTGGFVSGYRGSPLGTLDTAFGGARQFASERGIVVIPAVNEELGATAVAGSQQIEQTSQARYDGVFALWYGKGPGLDRASDAVRHGNTGGSSPHGGVVLAIGDDHTAKSSSLVVHSEDIAASLRMPVLYPSDPAEVVRFGLHGFAMSRLTGSWASLKIVTDVADSTMSVSADEMDLDIILPDVEAPPGGLHVRWPISPLEQEELVLKFRLPAVRRYARANQLDRSHLKHPMSRIGIVSAGKSWKDLQTALDLLGLDEVSLGQRGICLYKLGMVWPVEPEGFLEFASGLETILVIEEKGSFIENQLKAHLYQVARRPSVLGKSDLAGEPLFPETGDISAELTAVLLGRQLQLLGAGDDICERAAAVEANLSSREVASIARRPHFCSGCPHNRSTTLPAGSRGLAGIGCHGMAAYFMPGTGSFAQMGGEGIHWIGLSPFTDESHVFANLGDGTYFHSGILAIRQAVAAKVNMTYKLLYNSAVAMTGGQQVDGELSVESLVRQLSAEGVERIVLLSEDPSVYPRGGLVRRLAEVGSRKDLDATQLELRDTKGVSVLIYDQMCATEKRRLRKRDKLPEASARVFINEAVCEGCGDCSIQSNCLSVEPVATPFGTKRRINQSSCNKDYSCTDGFCPSFVTLRGGVPKRKTVPLPASPLADPIGRVDAASQRILVTGIGGTGVVTIGALLSMQAHIGGRYTAVLDQVGMAQKGGAVTSHVHISDNEVESLKIGAGTATLILACDQIVANSADALSAARRDSTKIIANADVAITGDFTRDRDAIADNSILARRLRARVGDENVLVAPFTKLAEQLLGDVIGSNLMMVGAAYQLGWLEMDVDRFREAVALNGQGVQMNNAAFEWGRRLVVDQAAVFKAAEVVAEHNKSFEEYMAFARKFLTEYQNAAWADKFSAVVSSARDAEAPLGSEAYSRAVAESLFKLMSYKDEYEVARLHSNEAFRSQLTKNFEDGYKLQFHLSPPVIARIDKATGRPRKMAFGGWIVQVFSLMARFKSLRGSGFDPMGMTLERRRERAAIGDFIRLVQELSEKLTESNLHPATDIARLPQEIKGYGPVKLEAFDKYELELATRLAAFHNRRPENDDQPSVPAAASV